RHDHGYSLNNSPADEGGLVARRGDHAGDGRDGERGTGTEAGRRQSRRQPAVIREPFQGAADGGAVYHASTQPGERVGEIKSGQRLGFPAAHQPIPASTPPIITSNLGPKVSTSQPSKGTSQVSSSTKMVNVTWMRACSVLRCF